MHLPTHTTQEAQSGVSFTQKCTDQKQGDTLHTRPQGAD
jgi:hypothetical protein